MEKSISKEKLIPLICSSCDGPVEIQDLDQVACKFCHEIVQIPASYREAFLLNQTASEEIDKATALWKRVDRRTFPRWLTIIIAYVPTLFLLGGMSYAFFADFANARKILLYTAWLPQLPLIALIVFVYWLGSTRKWAEMLRHLLAIRPNSQCRGCGAILPSTTELFQRCMYCQTDNLMIPSDQQISEVKKDIDSAQKNALAAIDFSQARFSVALWAMRYMVLIWMGFLILPIIWSLTTWTGIFMWLVGFMLSMLTLYTFIIPMGIIMEDEKWDKQKPYTTIKNFTVLTMLIFVLLFLWMFSRIK